VFKTEFVYTMAAAVKLKTTDRAVPSACLRA